MVKHQLLRRKNLTTGQIAKICGVAARTATRWIDDGQLPGFRIPGGKDRRVYPKDLISFLKQNEMSLDGLKEHYELVLVCTSPALIVPLERQLPPDKFKLIHACTAFDAGVQMGRLCPDAVVLDFAGLGRDACVQIAASIRGDLLFKYTRIIGIAAEDETHEKELRQSGFDHIYQHPFDPALLATTIEEDRNSCWKDD